MGQLHGHQTPFQNKTYLLVLSTPRVHQIYVVGATYTHCVWPDSDDWSIPAVQFLEGGGQ